MSQQLSEWFMYTISGDPLYHSKQILSLLYITETKPCTSYLIERKIMSSEPTYIAKSTRGKKDKSPCPQEVHCLAGEINKLIVNYN